MKKVLISVFAIVLILGANMALADSFPLELDRMPKELAKIWKAITRLEEQIRDIQLIPGPQGEQGVQGEVGPMGPQGPQGMAGGVSNTSQVFTLFDNYIATEEGVLVSSPVDLSLYKEVAFNFKRSGGTANTGVGIENSLDGINWHTEPFGLNLNRGFLKIDAKYYRFVIDPAEVGVLYHVQAFAQGDSGQHSQIVTFFDNYTTPTGGVLISDPVELSSHKDVAFYFKRTGGSLSYQGVGIETSVDGVNWYTEPFNLGIGFDVRRGYLKINAKYYRFIVDPAEIGTTYYVQAYLY